MGSEMCIRDRYHDKPDKNDYSHPADAEQYVCLGYLEGYDYDIEQNVGFEDDYHGRDAATGY